MRCYLHNTLFDIHLLLIVKFRYHHGYVDIVHIKRVNNLMIYSLDLEIYYLMFS